MAGDRLAVEADLAQRDPATGRADHRTAVVERDDLAGMRPVRLDDPTPWR